MEVVEGSDYNVNFFKNIRIIKKKMNRENNHNKVIITLCRVFPATHPKRGLLTGFEQKIKTGEKKHTIRNSRFVWDKRYHDILAGKKYLSLREWTGRPYYTEQREFARRYNIGLQNITMIYDKRDDVPQVWIDNKKVPIEEVAKNDGLSVKDFISWFFENGKSNLFEGVIIHFTPFRY